MMQDPRVLRKSSSSLASPLAPICRHVLWLELWTAAVVDYFFSKGAEGVGSAILNECVCGSKKQGHVTNSAVYPGIFTTSFC